jgi:hypothetical protein
VQLLKDVHGVDKEGPNGVDLHHGDVVELDCRRVLVERVWGEQQKEEWRKENSRDRKTERQHDTHTQTHIPTLIMLRPFLILERRMSEMSLRSVWTANISAMLSLALRVHKKGERAPERREQRGCVYVRQREREREGEGGSEKKNMEMKTEAKREHK